MKMRRTTHRLATLTTLSALTVLSAAAPGSARARDLTVNLQALSGHYVVAEGGGGGAVNANRAVAGPWEAFTMLDLTGGELVHGDPVALRTANGRFLRAGASSLDAAEIAPTGPAVFTLEIIKGGSPTEGAGIALRSRWTGLYVVAEYGGGDVVRANRGEARAWETFQLRNVRAAGREVAPGTLSAPFLTPGHFLPPIGRDTETHDSSDPGETQDCTDWRGRGAPHCYNGHTGTDFMLGGAFAQMDMQHVPVVAAMGGVVVEVDDGSVDHCHFDPTVQGEHRIVCPGRAALASNFVIVRQDDGLIAQYHHLRRDSVRVRRGDRVECGTWLADIGSSGISAAPHLHFELNRPRHGGAFVLGTGFGQAGNAEVVDPFREGLFAHLDDREIPVNVCVSPEQTVQCQSTMTRLDCGAHEDEIDAVCDGLSPAQGDVCAETEAGGCAETCADACAVTTEVTREIIDAGAYGYCLSLFGAFNPDAWVCQRAVREISRQVLTCRSQAAASLCAAADGTCVALAGEICHARCSEVCAPVQETLLVPCGLRATAERFVVASPVGGLLR